MRENEKLDLCGWMLDELLINLGNIKGENKGTLQYANLIVCLMLFFMIETLGFARRQWAFDISVEGKGKGIIGTSPSIFKNIKIVEIKPLIDTNVQANVEIPENTESVKIDNV